MTTLNRENDLCQVLLAAFAKIFRGLHAQTSFLSILTA
jgi:hypothetical protein